MNKIYIIEQFRGNVLRLIDQFPWDFEMACVGKIRDPTNSEHKQRDRLKMLTLKVKKNKSLIAIRK